MAYNSMQAMFEGLEPYNLSGVTITDQELGRGSYATILELDYLGLKCAGKKIHEILLEQEENSMIYAIRRFKDECQILSQVRHPNIVQFLGVFFQQGDHIPLLVMEFLPLNLDQCLEKHNLPNEMQYSILHDVALGLHYLHSQHSPIVHRDLSSNNVLLTSNMRAKISDLGVARILNLSPQKITRLTKAPGTPAFMPPEAMIADPKYDTSVDVFSYGILMIHTFSGKMPIPQTESIRTEGDCLIPVSEAERRESFLEAIGKDHPLMELILTCIHNNPGMRANTSEIVSQLADMVEQHPIQFTNQLDMMEYISQLEENEQTEVQTLLCTIEKAIDDFKTSLTDEVKGVMNHTDQSNSREFDELICVRELKRVDSHSVSSKSLSPHQQRRYENYTFLTSGPKDSTKVKLSRAVSDVSSTSIRYNSKRKDTKQEATLQAIKQNLKSHSTDEINRNKASNNDEEEHKLSPISPTANTSLKPTESTELTIDSLPIRRPKARYSSKPTTEETKHKSMPATFFHQHKPVLQRSKTSNWITHGERSAAVNVGLVSAPKQPQRGQEPLPILPKTCITSSEKELFTKENLKPRKLRISTTIKEEEEMDKGWKDSSPDSSTPKWKVTSSKKTEEKNEPGLQHSPAELTESGSFENSMSDYTKESVTTDDLVYPIYTARFDYEATSPSELSFRKGDQMHIKSKGDGKTWYASLTVGKGKREGYVPKSHVAALDDEEWFFGKMNSTTARNFVMTSSNQIGSFIVRQNKTTGVFSVTVRDQDKPRHYHILKHKNGMVYVYDKYLFRSISDLVQYHSRNAGGLCTTLAKPCIVPHCIADRTEVNCKEKLAMGQFSEVWKGEWKGEAVTVNKITPGAVTSFDLLDKCAFLKSMEHENHIQFVAVHMNSEPFLVISEYMTNGSLKEYLPSEGKDLNMAELIKMLEQVAAAMLYLEEHGCIHQELAAKNVMIEVKDKEALLITCKLSIYPYVHKVASHSAFHKLPAGTIPIRWFPHEAIVNNSINIKSNVWSFGILVWEIVNYCRSYPYPETSEAGVLKKLKQGYHMPRPLGCPKELYRLMIDCWKENASSRPTFEILYWRLRDFYSSDSFGYEHVNFK